MLKLPDHNGDTLPRSAAYVKTPLRFDRQSALVDGPTNGCTQESWHSRQVLCRELTLVAASGSERSRALSRQGDRVDFIPKGISVQDQGSLMVQVVKGSIPIKPWSCSEVSFGMAFWVLRLE